MPATPKKLLIIGVFGLALFVLIPLMMFLGTISVPWAITYFESTATREEETTSAMVVDKLRIFDFIQMHGAVPKSLAELPTTDGKGDATKDGWGKPIIYSFDTNGIVTLRAGFITNSFATKDSHGDWIQD